MEIHTDTFDAVTALAVKGRVDSTTADKLLDHLTAMIRGGCARLVIDLKDVTYISSAGFRTLLITARSVNAAMSNRRLTSPPMPHSASLPWAFSTERAVISSVRKPALLI
jgi:anti-anti-sigma factor